ncbi:hypothetical protein GQX74_002187 [Glossina fuscipes]|nr:hypothetical protein GQX74_002187 [Glossina fuscipes]
MHNATEANCESGQLEGYRFLFLLICAEVIVYLYEKQMLYEKKKKSFIELEPNLRNIRTEVKDLAEPTDYEIFKVLKFLSFNSSSFLRTLLSSSLFLTTLLYSNAYCAHISVLSPVN